MVKPNGPVRDRGLDFVKGVAIIFVVLLHSITYDDLYAVFAPWHMWQAIPLFVIVSGVLYAESSLRKNRTSFDEVLKSIVKLIKPAFIVWLAQILLILIVKGELSFNRLYELFKQGGFGTGGYFIYIAIQNIVLGGVYLYLVCKYKKAGLIIVAVVSVFIDIIAIYFAWDEEFYRILATRYALCLSLGMAYSRGILDLSKGNLFALAGLGGIYLIAVQLFLFHMQPVYPSWHSHTALSGFLAFYYFIFLKNTYSLIDQSIAGRSICKLGESSYYIFLIQMTFFWFKRWFEAGGIYFAYGFASVLFELALCLGVGLMFAKLYRLYDSRKMVMS
jgi:peptidoglycan/LPS O-acetylase OafA/YrhL